jgi:hypothetical protein
MHHNSHRTAHPSTTLPTSDCSRTLLYLRTNLCGMGAADPRHALALLLPRSSKSFEVKTEFLPQVVLVKTEYNHERTALLRGHLAKNFGHYCLICAYKPFQKTLKSRAVSV